ncbi:MAG: hypothetical protein GWP03_01055 [Proteobacteria bacterium]|nr:hypothetical protein [Pseudomonadota bacterium]
MILIKRTVLIIIFVPAILLSGNLKRKEILSLKWGNSPGEVGLKQLGINLMGPRCYFVDKKGNIYILDNGNDRITIFNSNGVNQNSLNLNKFKNINGTEFTDITVDDSGYIYLLGYFYRQNNNLSLVIFKNNDIARVEVIKGDIFDIILDNPYNSSNFVPNLMEGTEKLFVKDGRVWLNLGGYTFFLANTIYSKIRHKQFTLTKFVKCFKFHITSNGQLVDILNKKFGNDWDYIGQYKDLYMINMMNDTIISVNSSGVIKNKIAINLKIKYFEGNYISYIHKKSLYFMENDSNGITISSVDVKDILNN